MIFLGIILKCISGFFLALRFIYLKKYDTTLDTVSAHFLRPLFPQVSISTTRDADPEIDQHMEDRILDLLKDDVYSINLPFVGVKRMHKYLLYNYMTIPMYMGCDFLSLMYIPFTLFSLLSGICPIVIYQLLLPPLLQDPVDWNEWAAVAMMGVIFYFISFFGPTTDVSTGSLGDIAEWINAKMSLSTVCIVFLCFLLVTKVFTFFYLSRWMAYYIKLKDEEVVSDLFQPRPMSFYNLCGPVHLACNAVLATIATKALVNETSGLQGLPTMMFEGVGIVLAGGGSVFLVAHSYDDIIAELHSATVFPIFLILQAILGTLSGILLFYETPEYPVGFYLSCVGMMMVFMVFVGVMEYNEPHGQYEVMELPEYSESESLLKDDEPKGFGTVTNE